MTNEILHQNSRYIVRIDEVRDAAFPSGEVTMRAYVVVNRLTEIIEKETAQLPTAIRFAEGLDEAMDELEAEQAEIVFEADIDKPTVN